MKYYLFNHAKGQQYYVLVGDIIVLLLAIAASYSIRIFINNDLLLTWGLLWEKITPWLILVVIPHLFSLYLLGLYNLNRLINQFRSSVFIVMSVLLAGLIIGSIFFFFPRYIFGRQVLVIHLIVSSLFLVCWRIAFHEVVAGRTRAKRMAVIGNAATVSRYVQEIKVITGGSIVVSAVCFTGESHCDIVDVSIYKKISTLLESNDFDILVYDPLSNVFGAQEIQSILEEKYHGKVVFDLPSFYKNLTGKIPLHYIDGNWLLQQEGLQGYVSKPYVYMKRLLDLFMAASLLLLFFPLGLLIGTVVKLDSKGTIIFSQERLGMHRMPFKCLKFRTMMQDAEKTSGPVWSSGDSDPRITRVGKVLRKTRLDELPQLWNILKGELSFVGPRPIRKHFADKLSAQIPYYDMRFSVQPGLSGWAQVSFDYAGSEKGQHEKFEYELFYIQNMSFFLDVFTIIKTVRSVFHGEGK